MSHNKEATQQLLESLGLAPGSQQFADQWLSAWDGSDLPGDAEFEKALSQDIRRFTVFSEYNPRGGIPMRFVGEEIKRLARADLTGLDYVDIAPPETRGERMRRVLAAVSGAIIRITHQLTLKTGGEQFVETVSVPLREREGGLTTMVCFMDISGLMRQDGETPEPEAFAGVPDITEIVPIPGDAAMTYPGHLAGKGLRREEQVKMISRAADRLVLNIIMDAMMASPLAGLDPVDYLIAITVGSANVSHIDNDAHLSRQFAGLIEPDSLRHGISRAAISRATMLPLETVRRRINRLLEIGIFLERDDGIILSAGNKYKVDARTDRMHAQARLVERMFRDLRARGVNIG
jgi:hypothetical protein